MRSKSLICEIETICDEVCTLCVYASMSMCVCNKLYVCVCIHVYVCVYLYICVYMYAACCVYICVVVEIRVRNWLAIFLKIEHFVGYWSSSHWKCTVKLADQNGFWLSKCWNWSENGQWPTVISSTDVYVCVHVYICVCSTLCLCVYMCIYVYVAHCVYVCTCVCAYMCTVYIHCIPRSVRMMDVQVVDHTWPSC